MIGDRSIAIFWFRRDLRLHDNHALFRALEQHAQVLPIFIFERSKLDPLTDMAHKGVTLLHQRLTALQDQLTRQGSSLWSFYGEPLDAFRQLLDEYQVSAVYANRDYAPDDKIRDAAVTEFLDAKGVSLHLFSDRCMLDSAEFTDGLSYDLEVFEKRWRAGSRKHKDRRYPSQERLEALAPFAQALPLVGFDEIGFKPAPLSPPPLEPERLLRDHTPGIEDGSLQNVHLRLGALSIRESVTAARSSKNPLVMGLVRRDYHTLILDQHPHMASAAFRPKFDRIAWRRDADDLDRWKQGQTGVPLVDAGMRQLRDTGLMPYKVRVIAAAFLVKHLLIDWREGLQWFAAKLLDYDHGINAGNWQWVAGCGPDPLPWRRVPNPWTATRRLDPELTYIKAWVPECHSVAYGAAMVNHDMARLRALEAYGKALEEDQLEELEEAPLFS